MPDDPNKKMDELLKAYAEERRKAPELNLHPATRKMLQGEVARAIGSGRAPRSWRDRFRSFWPQIAFGTSLCLILGIAVVSLRHQPPSPEVENTSREKNVNAADKAALAPALEPGQDASQEKKKDALGREESEQLQQVELRLLKSEQQPSAPPLELAKERFVLQEAQVSAPAPVPTTLQRDDASLPEIAAAGARQKPAPAQQPQSPPQDLSLQDQRPSKPTALGDSYGSANSVRSQSTSVDSEARSRTPRPAAPTAPAEPSALSAASPATAPAFSANNARGLPPADVATVANRGLQIPPAEKLARANEMTNLGAALRLQFVQAAATTPLGAASASSASSAAGTATPTALFTSFQMEQFGNDIRFVENDGSVYLGIIDQPASLPAQTQALADTVAERRVGERLEERLSAQKANAAAPVTAAALTNSTAFNFTAQGTNLTLGKTIVLTGQYFEKTNSPPALDSLAVSQKSQAAGRAYQPAEPQHMIIGTAVIETTNQIPVRAISRDNR